MLGELIRVKRRSLVPERTQKQICLAAKEKYPNCSVSQVTLSAVENGNLMPSSLTLVAICDAIGIDPVEVWGALQEELKSRGNKNDSEDR